MNKYNIFNNVLIIVLLLFSIQTATADTVNLSVGAITDTYVLSSSPNNNYGSDWTLPMVSSSYVAYMKINISSLQTSNISSAKIYYYASGDGATVSIFNVTSSLNISNVTWNTKPTLEGSPFVVATETLTASLAWYSLDVTGLVQGWHNGTIPENGMAFTADIASSLYSIDSGQSPSRKPYLSVEYTPAYTPPVPISLTAAQGNFWINHSWTNGTGNITDSYNVSQNGTWVNSTTATFNNTTVLPHGWSNITVYAYNSSGTGTLSTQQA